MEGTLGCIGWLYAWIRMGGSLVCVVGILWGSKTILWWCSLESIPRTAHNRFPTIFIMQTYTNPQSTLWTARFSTLPTPISCIDPYYLFLIGPNGVSVAGKLVSPFSSVVSQFSLPLPSRLAPHFIGWSSLVFFISHSPNRWQKSTRKMSRSFIPGTKGFSKK